MMFDPFVISLGLLVGTLVGLTGIGGGALLRIAIATMLAIAGGRLV